MGIERIFPFALMMLSIPNLSLAGPALPDNTLNCEQFHKDKDGTWVADQDFTFDFGADKNISLPKTAIPHFLYYAGGMDLADALEMKCGSR